MNKATILCLSFLAVFSSSVLAAEKKPQGAGVIDVYKYWPWKPGTAWKGSEIGSGIFGRSSAVIKSLGPGDGAEIRVQWPGDWLDHYRETEKGLERPKDFNTANGAYGVYTPPAIQYPHYTKLGEIYRRTAVRRDYSADDNQLGPEVNEEMTYVALGFEDVSVPAGLFKDCLLQVRNYRTMEAGGVERRKISISWNAPGVGLVRGCLTEFRGGKMLKNGCAELTDLEQK